MTRRMEMNLRKRMWVAMTAAALFAAPALANPTLADGEVRRIDRAAGKITLKHGEIKNLEMPPMQMVFKVKDPSALDRLKVGDRVRFEAAHIDGAYTVTRIDPAD